MLISGLKKMLNKQKILPLGFIIMSAKTRQHTKQHLMENKLLPATGTNQIKFHRWVTSTLKNKILVTGIFIIPMRYFYLKAVLTTKANGMGYGNFIIQPDLSRVPRIIQMEMLPVRCNIFM